MKIVGIEGMTGEELDRELDRGGRFVLYEYCISVLVLTFRRPSNIHFLRGHEGGLSKGIGFSCVSLLFGWWGIPWGPIYTIATVATNMAGGKDVTNEVVASLQEATA